MISHVQHSEEAAAEAEAQCDRALRLKRQSRIIQLQLFKCVTQIGILGAVLGVNAAVHHGAGGAVAGQGLGGGRSTPVTVSPTWVSFTFLMEAVK